MEKQQNKKKISMAAPIFLLSVSGVFFLLYNYMDRPIEKVFVLFMAATVILPFIPVFLSSILTIGITDAKHEINSHETYNYYNNQYNNKYSFKGKKIKQNKPNIQYKKKEINNPEYLELRNLVIASSKNKLLSRSLILQLKEKINKVIGKELILYKPITFKNDMHEIYIKLKSSRLTDKDYISLKEWLLKEITKEQIS